MIFSNKDILYILAIGIVTGLVLGFITYVISQLVAIALINIL